MELMHDLWLPIFKYQSGLGTGQNYWGYLGQDHRQRGEDFSRKKVGAQTFFRRKLGGEDFFYYKISFFMKSHF